MPWNFIKKKNHKVIKSEINSDLISRQPFKRRFLLLEILIALFLIATFALPLAQIPTRATAEILKSAHRMQVKRLADLAFADIKEQFYCNDISWHDIVKSTQQPVEIYNDVKLIDMEDIGKRKWICKGKLRSVSKSGPHAEWYLGTVFVYIEPTDKALKAFRAKGAFRDKQRFTYQILLCHENAQMPSKG